MRRSKTIQILEGIEIASTNLMSQIKYGQATPRQLTPSSRCSRSLESRNRSR